MKFDAIVLAGDKGSSFRFKQNKACLKINGQPIIRYIIDVLDTVEEIDRVYIIGPKLDLENIFKDNQKKLTRIFEQGNNLLENIWKVYLNISAENNNLNQDKPILFMAGDIPLLTGQEIKYFLSHCDLNQNDFFVGLTPEESLSRFYPTNTSPGIKLAYFHFKEKKYRISNIYLAKPHLLIEKKEYIQKVYDYRYQKKLRNILRLSWEMLKIKGGVRLLKYYALAQIAMFLSSVHLLRLSKFFQSRCPLSAIEEFISDLLQVRYKGIEVPFGGSALDIDNEMDYKIIEVMFDDWKKHLSSVNENPAKQ